MAHYPCTGVLASSFGTASLSVAEVMDSAARLSYVIRRAQPLYCAPFCFVVRGGGANGGSGGAVYSVESHDVTLDRSMFLSNVAFGNGNSNFGGGGLHIASSHFDITGCTFRENNITDNGGGVAQLSSDSTLSVSSSIFESNRALNGDGGVFSGIVDKVTDSTFVANTASGNGGVLSGLTVYETGLTVGGGEFENCNFSSNAAGVDGKGALFFTTAKTSITASVIHGTKTPNSDF